MDLVRAALLSIPLGLVACGDDTSASGGGGPGGSGSTADASSSVTTADASSASSTTSTTAASTSASSSATTTGGSGACSWPGADPGDLVSTGNLVGDVIENVSGLVDQCGVARSLWDFAGGYRILSMTPGW